MFPKRQGKLLIFKVLLTKRQKILHSSLLSFCVMFEKFSEIWANWSKWTLAFGRGDDAAVLYQSNPISTDNKSNDQDHTEVLGKMCQKNWKPNIFSVRRSYRQKTNQLETTSDYLTKRAKLKKHPKIIQGRGK